MAVKYEINKRNQSKTHQRKKKFEKRQLLIRNLVLNADGKQSGRSEAALNGNINCEKYTINKSLHDKAQFFLKNNLTKTKIAHLDANGGAPCPHTKIFILRQACK